jgi:glycosyltransferase involved in cell wall biosynthesis
MPLVSVFLITYNHEKFVSQAIESVLKQKVNFEFEIVIGVDLSSDRTGEICLDYEAKFPNCIRVLIASERLGMQRNALRIFNECNAKYVAFLDGDDFWVDDEKLQVQVDFLEANSGFNICASNSIVLNDRVDKVGSFYPDVTSFRGGKFGMNEYILSAPLFQTSSALIRRDSKLKLPFFLDDSIAVDWPLFAVHLQSGLGYVFPKVMSCYRIHESGITNVHFNAREHYFMQTIAMIESLNSYLDYKYNRLFKRRKVYFIKKLIMLYRSQLYLNRLLTTLIGYLLFGSDSFNAKVKLGLKVFGFKK